MEKIRHDLTIGNIDVTVFELKEFEICQEFGGYQDRLLINHFCTWDESDYTVIENAIISDYVYSKIL